MAEHLSIKENYMRMMRAEIPEYVPRYSIFWSMGVSALRPPMSPEVKKWKDMWGVTYVVEWNANNGALPEPNNFILDDIRKWRDVVKRPAILDEVDWELTSKRDLDARNPELPIVGGGSLGNGYFQMLMAFMGFNNGLVACLEEPEEVKALLNFILELNIETGKKFLKYYKPEVYMMGDDIAHERMPFVSEEVFLDLFEPMWRKNTALFKEAGLPANHHNCGYIQPFVKYIVDMGFNSMDPSQVVNDLKEIKATYGRKFAICGGFPNNGMASWPETTEEEIRAEVRRVMDELAPGGGFSFGGNVMGPPGDPFAAERNAWITDEYEKNKFKYYN